MHGFTLSNAVRSIDEIREDWKRVETDLVNTGIFNMMGVDAGSSRGSTSACFRSW